MTKKEDAENLVKELLKVEEEQKVLNNKVTALRSAIVKYVMEELKNG